MTSILTNDEKTGMVVQHKKNVAINKYNLELSLIEENALETPNAETISSLESQISAFDAKLAALDAELSALTE
jgi:hypothetical protein